MHNFLILWNRHLFFPFRNSPTPFLSNLWFVVLFVFSVPPKSSTGALPSEASFGLCMYAITWQVLGYITLGCQLKIHLAPDEFPRKSCRYGSATGCLSTLPWQQTHHLTPIYHTPTVVGRWYVYWTLNRRQTGLPTNRLGQPGSRCDVYSALSVRSVFLIWLLQLTLLQRDG